MNKKHKSPFTIISFTFFLVISLFVLSQASEQELIKQPIQIIESKELDKIIPFEIRQDKVIILYVSSPFCRYCRKLEKEILHPMIKSGDYIEKVLLRKLVIDSKIPVTNFNADRQLPKSLMKEYNVKTTPTLLFLDKKGNQLSEAIIGYSNDEFFWYYLDTAIEKSNQKLKKTAIGSGI